MGFKTEVFRLLRAANATRAVVKFSGGNDEGGADEIELTLADGTTREIRENMYLVDEPDDARLAGLLCKPMDDKYGSFAGEFYVSGEIVYDVAAGTVQMSGDEEVPQSSHFSEDL